MVNRDFMCIIRFEIINRTTKEKVMMEDKNVIG